MKAKMAGIEFEEVEQLILSKSSNAFHMMSRSTSLAEMKSRTHASDNPPGNIYFYDDNGKAIGILTVANGCVIAAYNLKKKKKDIPTLTVAGKFKKCGTRAMRTAMLKEKLENI